MGIRFDGSRNNVATSSLSGFVILEGSVKINGTETAKTDQFIHFKNEGEQIELEALEKKIPPTAEVSNLLALLSHMADASRIGLHGFQVGKIQSQNTRFELPVTLKLTASFPKLIHFGMQCTKNQN